MADHLPRAAVRSLITLAFAGMTALACSGGSEPAGPVDPGPVGPGTPGPGTPSNPDPDPAVLRAEQVSVGDATQCARTKDQKVLCWGLLGWVIGDGTREFRTHPVPIDLANVKMGAVSVGNANACALDVDGVAYCWGRQKLGDGTEGSASPTPVPGEHVFTTIDAGLNTACALKEDGAAWCWGSDAGGAMHTSPVPVSSTLRFSNVIPGSRPEGGFSRACGLTLDQAIYCWGISGIGNPESVIPDEAPTLVDSPVMLSTLANSGRRHFCGLTEEGKAYCWGRNIEGQLGTGTVSDSEDTPQPVAGGLTFATLSAGLNHSCGIVQTGDMYCWGSQRNGLLGNGLTENAILPTPQLVKAPTGVKFSSVAAGLKSSCAISTTSTVYCWGERRTSEFEVTLDSTPTPVPISDGP